MKQLKASSGVFTIGSLLTLKEVLTITGQLVFSLNFFNNLKYIGFVSSFFKNHTVSILFKNWIIKLNRNFFSIFVYYIGNKFDKITSQIKESSNDFFNHTDIDQLISRISKDKLDILVYLDICMDPMTQILASLRLASIQCTTWGHPVTSGFKNIDYFYLAIHHRAKL